jgi:hypothetical protein
MRNLLGYLTLVQCADILALIMSHALVGDWEPSQIIVRNGSGRLLNQLVGELMQLFFFQPFQEVP